MLASCGLRDASFPAFLPSGRQRPWGEETPGSVRSQDFNTDPISSRFMRAIFFTLTPLGQAVSHS